MPYPQAWRRFHAVLCPGTTGLPDDASSPIRNYYDADWTQGGVNYADTFYVAFIVYAHVVCQVRSQRWRGGYYTGY